MEHPIITRAWVWWTPGPWTPGPRHEGRQACPSVS